MKMFLSTWYILGMLLCDGWRFWFYACLFSVLMIVDYLIVKHYDKRRP